MALSSESTSFTLDNMGRFLCNTLQEARDSAGQSVAGRTRNFDVITVKSAASDRSTYLRRPDLGRTLSPQSAAQLDKNPQPFTAKNAQHPILTIILADGLSALAVDRHAIPLLDALLPLLTPSWRLTPIVITEQARVAIADLIGQALNADLTLLLIGERPGLSSPDSLGAYLTWAPRPGRTDAERNCVSNIRTQGLDYAPAAHRIAALASEARRLQLTGTTLKDLDLPPTLTSKPTPLT